MCFGFFSSQTDGTMANYVLLSEGNFSRLGIFLDIVMVTKAY